MKISFVVAADENGVIGLNDRLPWHLPDDLRYFKKNTMGKPIIMGRKTFFSFGKALPGRTNIILSQTLKDPPENTLVFKTMAAVLEFLKERKTPEACIIGGGVIFKTFRSLCDEILLTHVHTKIEGGTTFFELPTQKDWELVWSEPHYKDEKHGYDFTFERWIKKAD